MRESKYTNHGVNKETYKLLFDEKEEYKKECSNEIYTIEMSSCYDRKIYYQLLNLIKMLIDMYYRGVNYFNIHKNIFEKGYTFKNDNIKFKFDYLEKYLKRILKNEDSYVRKELICYLKHNLRYGSCFYTSMIISENIDNSYFVTGLIPFKDGTTHLHSFVEYGNYVIDYTKNLIVSKEIYYKLLRVKELQRIPSESISEIYNTLLENRILNTARYIATFGNDIINDLNKNAQLVKKVSGKADFTCLFD